MLLIVEIAEAFVAISVSLDVMLLALVAISESFELIFDALVVILEALDAISVSLELIWVSCSFIAATKLVAEVFKSPIVPILVELELMLVALVAMSESFELMLVELVLMLDSTSVKSPNAKVPSISASLSIVTVPEVWPKDKSPVEKSPVIRSYVSPIPVHVPFSSNVEVEVEIYNL